MRARAKAGGRGAGDRRFLEPEVPSCLTYARRWVCIYGPTVPLTILFAVMPVDVSRESSGLQFQLKPNLDIN